MILTSTSMKWTPGQCPAQLRDTPVVLVFGTDPGGIDALVKDILQGQPTTHLQADETTPSHLSMLLNTGSLFGPSDAVVVRNVKDTHLPLVENAWHSDTRLILVGGNLKKTGKLVKAFEANAAGVQLFALDAKNTVTWLANALEGLGVTLSNDARALTERLLPGNRSEINQLAQVLSLSALGHKRTTVTSQDLLDVVPELSDIDLGGALDAALMGKLADALVLLDRQLASGENPIGLMRLWAWKLQRLDGMVQTGLSPKDAVAKARPPVFWKDKALFESALKRLGKTGVNALIQALDNAERQSVNHGQPVRILADQFLVKAAQQKGT